MTVCCRNPGSKVDNCSQSHLDPEEILQTIEKGKGQELEKLISSGKKCEPKYSVFLVVPYRNRKEHLEVFKPFFDTFLEVTWPLDTYLPDNMYNCKTVSAAKHKLHHCSG